MRLFHFMRENYLLSNVENKRIKVSRFDSLNDPFECVYKTSSVKETEYDFQTELSERFGMISMSSEMNEPLMWGHYTENYKGCCLELDVKDSEKWKAVLEKVKYESNGLPHKNIIEIDDFEDSILTEKKDDKWSVIATKIMTYKYHYWAYEKEQRYIIHLPCNENVVGNTKIQFFKFNDDFRLKNIYLGDCCTLKPYEVYKTLLRSGQMDVGIYKTQRANSSYSVEKGAELEFSQDYKNNLLKVFKYEKTL